MTTSEVAEALERAIAQRIGEQRYNLWFERNTKFTWEDGLLILGVPNHFFQEWLQKTFGEAVRAAATEVLGRPMEVRFVIDPELFQVARRAQAEAGGATAGRGRGTDSVRIEGDSSTAVITCHGQHRGAHKRTRRWRRLGDFVVGSCNRVAHASAMSMVESPEQSPNPLVLHGPVGTGKTHLLEGIYVGLRKQQPEWRVCFMTSEDFTNRFVQAMRNGKLGAFRKHYRDCDALLVDDLHFLASKRATQEEFLHTFDAIQAGGQPVVITCDCHPRLADTFGPELTDRLVGGAVWSLTPPEEETRLALLRARSAQEGIAVPEDVLRHLAAQLRGNVRELEGALHSLRHYSRVLDRPIDLCLARQALGELLRQAVRSVQLADVDRSVCQVLRLESGSLQSRLRTWTVSHPRMLAMFLARKYTSAAYSEIGRYFGGRNHSTAVAAEKKIRQWLQADGQLQMGEQRLRLREAVERIERELLR